MVYGTVGIVRWLIALSTHAHHLSGFIIRSTQDALELHIQYVMYLSAHTVCYVLVQTVTVIHNVY